MQNLLFFHILSCLFFFSCKVKSEEKKKLDDSNASYDLSSPVNTYILPTVLNEVSGICFVSDTAIACVQDEDGKIFIFNPSSQKISQTIEFARDGDYEDIAKTGDAYYILRSDGSLFKYSNGSTTKIDTELSSENNTESLCFDKDQNLLIIGCKEGEKNFYPYKFNQGLGKESLFTIKHEKVAPSAIAIHPITKKYFVLSRNKLLVLSREGKTEDELDLKSSLFLQPEGLTFKENGNMLISNEARGKQAAIHEFKFKGYER
ncbi:MAG: hypothetical protein K2X86_16060 [Cytophagaceae bacterium]|nr:hypothetical protein [Cytophagaceae bacterium]